MEIDLNDVAVFNEVVAAGGFTAAGRRLGLPASAVSRRVSRLETRLGFKLLHRTTRSVGLTEAGRVYHQHTESISASVERAAQAVHDTRGAPTGLLRITAPPDDGGVIWELLRGFIARHPSVDVEVIHTLDRIDLVQSGVDLALRGGSVPDSAEFTAHELFNSRILLVASPEYLASRGVPTTVQELDAHDCIGMDTWAPNAIRSLDAAGGPVRLTLRNRVRSNRLNTLHDAALAGFGIAPLLRLTCAVDIQQGRLVEVLDGALPPEAKMWLVYPARGELSVAARALATHIIGEAPKVVARRRG